MRPPLNPRVAPIAESEEQRAQSSHRGNARVEAWRRGRGEHRCRRPRGSAPSGSQGPSAPAAAVDVVSPVHAIGVGRLRSLPANRCSSLSTRRTG